MFSEYAFYKEKDLATHQETDVIWTSGYERDDLD